MRMVSADAALIHPTAIIEEGARIDAGSRIGAYAWVGSRVKLGEHCNVHHHATVDGNTTLGPRCEVWPYAFVGGKTQDLKFRGGHPELIVGANNTFREFCTVHCGTLEGKPTRIGDHNHLLAYSHVGHECRLGSHIIMSNNATLAGHIEVGDHAVLGGMAGVHQFCRIGAHAMIGGCTKVVQDIAPFMMADGIPARTRFINQVGLERRGFSEAQRAALRRAFKWIFRDRLAHDALLDRLESEASTDAARLDESDALLRAVADFIRQSQRGLA